MREGIDRACKALVSTPSSVPRATALGQLPTFICRAYCSGHPMGSLPRRASETRGKTDSDFRPDVPRRLDRDRRRQDHPKLVESRDASRATRRPHRRRRGSSGERADGNQEGADRRRLLEVEEHRQPVDLGRRQVGHVCAVGDEHGAGRREAGPTSLPARQQPGSRDRERHRAGVLAGLQVARVQVDASGGGRGGRGGRGGGGGGAQPGGAAPGQNARGGTGAAPTPPRHVELRNLATGAVQSWQDIQSFTFAATSSHLVLRRRAPGAAAARRVVAAATAAAPGGGGPGAAGGAANAEPTGPRGADVILHDLATGRDQLLGSVGDIAFNKKGDLLAYTVDARRARRQRPVRARPAQRPHHRRSTTTRASTAASRGTTNGTGLAVLKGVDVDKMRERDNMLLVVSRRAGGARRNRSTRRSSSIRRRPTDFPKGWVLSDRAALDVERRQQAHLLRHRRSRCRRPTRTRRRRSGDEVADVDVWNTNDERIQSVQMTRADADRNFTYPRGVQRHGTASSCTLADSTMRELDVSAGRPLGRRTRHARLHLGLQAPGRGHLSRQHLHRRAHADPQESAHRPARVRHLAGRQLLPLLEGQQVPGVRPRRRHDEDARRRSHRRASSTCEFDHPGPKPSYGIAGYTQRRQGRDRRSTSTICGSCRSTDRRRRTSRTARATKSEIRFRYVRDGARLERASAAAAGRARRRWRARRARRWREARSTCRSRVTLSAYGEYTKKAGFYQLADGQLKELVYDDASYSQSDEGGEGRHVPLHAADVHRVPGPARVRPRLQGLEEDHDANPQQSEYLWGHRILFDFKDKDGHQAAGASSRSPTTTSRARSARCS